MRDFELLSNTVHFAQWETYRRFFLLFFSQARIKEGKREKFRAWPIASAKLTLDSYKQRQTSGSEQPHLIKSPPPVLYYCSLAKNPQLSKMTLCKTFLRFSLPSLALQGTIKIFNFFSDYIYVEERKREYMRLDDSRITFCL